MKMTCPSAFFAFVLFLSLPLTSLASNSPGITTQPQSTNVLTGSNAVFTVVAGGQLPLSYQWSFNSVNLANSSHIAGATTTTLTVSNITAADNGNYQVLVSNMHGSLASSNAVLTVLFPPAITTQPVSQSVLLSNSVVFGTTVTGTLPLSCQWYFNGTPLTDGPNIINSFTPNLTLTDLQISEGGNYQLVVTNNYGSATSMIATLTILVPALITTQPTNQTVSLGSSVTFTAAARGTDPVDWQWYFNGAPLSDGGRISGSLTPSLNISDAQLTDAGAYYVTANNPYGAATSLTATLTTVPVTHYVGLNSINPTPPFTDWGTAARNIQDAIDIATPGDSIVVDHGVYTSGNRAAASTTNCVVATNAVSISSFYGPGQTTIDGGGTNRCVYLDGGATLTGFTLKNGAAFEGAGVYCASSNEIVADCIVSSNNYLKNAGLTAEGGGAYGGTLTNCTLTYNMAELGAGAFNSFLIHCAFTDNWSWSNGGGACSCILTNCALYVNECQDNGAGAEDCTLYNCTLTGCFAAGEGADGGGADSSTLYNCLLTGDLAYGDGGGASGSILVNCTVAQNGAYYTGGGGVLNCSLTNSIVYYNYNFISANAENYDGNNQFSWCCATPMPATGTGNITNAPLFVDLTNEFHLMPGSPCIDTGNNSFVATGTDLDGNPRIVNSTVDMGCYEYQYLPIFMITQPVSQSSTIGQTVSFSVIATGSPALNYQWFFDGTNIDGATNATLTLTNIQLAETGTYSVTLSNSLAFVVSSNATLTVAYPPPVILSQPTNLLVFASSNAAFSAAVLTYSPTVYQWVTNGVPLTDGGRISGSATTNLVISNVQISDGGNYQLIATNDYGSATSAVATLTIYPVTTAVIQPQNLVTNGGANVTFNATISGQGPLSYQWQLNGTNLPGATNTSYTLTGALGIQSGAYDIAVSNAAGVVVSPGASLTVIPSIAVSIYPNPAIADFQDVSFWLQSAGFSTNTIYQWQFNGANTWTWNNSSQVTNFYVSLADAGSYDIIANDSGLSVTSSVVPLTILALGIENQPVNESAFSGGTATFSVYAGGLPPVTYQWLFNGAIIPGATNGSITLTNITPPQAGLYSVVLTNAYGMITSSNALLTVTNLLVISQPTNQITWPNGRATFKVNVAGQPPLGFDWQCNGVDVPGIWTNVLTITNVQPSQFGTYDVIVSNAWGSTTSSNAALMFSQVAVWGGTGGESNLTPGLTNIIAIAAGSYPAFDCMALNSNGIAIHWPQTNMNVEATAYNGVSNLLSIAGGGIQGGPPFYVLESNGVLAEWLVDDIVESYFGFTNFVAIPAETLFGPAALMTNGTVISPSVARGPIIYATNAVAIAEGEGFGLALLPNGTITSFGTNPSGTNFTPGLTNVVAIAAAYNAGFAVKSDGTVAAWGQNVANLVTFASTLSNVVAVAGGQEHALALLTNGTVVAWGENIGGSASVPPGLTNVIAIAAGPYHDMALIGNGPPVLNVPLPNPVTTPNGLTFSIPSQSGRVYMLQYLNSLTDTNWISLPLVPGNGHAVLLTDPSPTNSQRFYRVQRW